MAYVIWRVVMKKYSRVRLGLHKASGISVVTPTSAITYKEELWTPKLEDEEHVQCETASSSNEKVPENRQSKTKRVKNYLRKCKNALSGASSNEKNKNAKPANEMHPFETETCNTKSSQNDATNVITEEQTVTNVVDSVNETVGDYRIVELSPPLDESQEQVDADTKLSLQEIEDETTEVIVKGEVAGLVDRHFSKIYDNYKNSRKCLIRQARDLLLCEYHGSLQRFEKEFCIPAAQLLGFVKNEHSKHKTWLPGWPLCLGSAGIIMQLGVLSPNIVRHKDCYLCIKTDELSQLRVVLIWRKFSKIYCRTLAEFSKTSNESDEIEYLNVISPMELDMLAVDETKDGMELHDLLQNMLISVEHAIQKIHLDDLTNLCPKCFQYISLEVREESDTSACSCQCSCLDSESTTPTKQVSLQANPMFEFVGKIPHIDSDDEEDREPLKFEKIGNQSHVIDRPKRIIDIPEKLLMSGINLPGIRDLDGFCIILCFSECLTRTGLNEYEVAQVMLYYASIPSTKEAENVFTILLLAETNEEKALELLDAAVALIKSHIKICKILIWKPKNISEDSRYLNASHVKGIVIKDECSLNKFISEDQAPTTCGGNITHDQLEWVEFFKQLEPFIIACRTAGQALLLTMSHLRSEEIPSQLNKKYLNHQYRQIAKALQLETVVKLRQDGETILRNLEERAQWLISSSDVKHHLEMACMSFNVVVKVVKKLEQLATERKERLKEMLRLKTLENEANALLTWIFKTGDDTLQNQDVSCRNATNLTEIKVVEKQFENFYFDAMRQLDKATELIEEITCFSEFKAKNLKESIVNLKPKVKSFMEELEETRENIEDCCRCFLLVTTLDREMQEDCKSYETLKNLALKTKNYKLIEVTKELSESRILKKPPESEETLQSCSDEVRKRTSAEFLATSTPIKTQAVQLRRRSVSSMAYIYKCNHHAAGMSCNCYEKDLENSISYKLKKQYMQSLQNFESDTSAGDVFNRKNSLTLDGIKEVRESAENLLDEMNKNNLTLSECERCDSGVSTAENSVGEESIYKKRLQRSCSCRLYGENCPSCSVTSFSLYSNQDQSENRQDIIIEEGDESFNKSGSEDIDDHYNEQEKSLPISANSHLHFYSPGMQLFSESTDSCIDPKTQKTLLFIMREMIQTERDYVKSLDYVIENYIPQLMREDIPQALRGQRNVIFGNVEKIFEFHSQHFLRELEKCESNPLQIGQIFLKHNKRFYLYALYNKNKPKSDSLMSEYGSKFFKAKQIQLGDKMDLASYLLKPVQRMGKYALLLQQMMKAGPSLPATASERLLSEQDDLKQAEEMVRFQLRHGNDLLAMDSIRECDVNLKEQGRLMRQNEFIVWEGRTGKKCLRQVFLFEDLILFSKARRFPDRKNLDLFIYKNSIKLTDIGLTAKIGESPTKFEIWFRKRKPNDTFTIQANSEDTKKAWTEELSQLLWKQAIKNREVRMAEMSSMGIGNKPCLDIRPSADQINDRSISVAQLNKTAPRFRNSIAGPIAELYKTVKRPQSVISMSSMSTSDTTSSSGSAVTPTSNSMQRLDIDSVCNSPKPCRRSGTLTSQCSTESGIIADMSVGSDECTDNNQSSSHWSYEKTTSTNVLEDSTTQTNVTQLTIYSVSDDIPIDI